MSNSNLNLIQGSGDVLGTGLDDNIVGSNGVDDIKGRKGNDGIKGLGSSDRLSGGNGNDALIGGSGNDTLVGGAGSDTLVGTDYASGGRGEIDRLRGGNGPDTFVLGEVKSALQTDSLRHNELGGQTARQKQYYLDNGVNDGNKSYAIIEDFNPAQGDKIQLINPAMMGNQVGTLFDQKTYVVRSSPIQGIQGSAIYLSSPYNSFESEDLVAIVQFAGNPSRQVNLQAQYISYVGEPAPSTVSSPIESPIEPDIFI